MLSKRLTPLWYQVNKHVNNIIKTNHPWIFRTHLNSLTNSFSDGQLLKLVNGNNVTVGYGIYSSVGAIGIRIFKKSKVPPSLEWIKSILNKALEKRKNLMRFTNSLRLIHGENDGFPSITVDIYGMNTLILQNYSKSFNTFGRYIASVLAEKLNVPNIIWKSPIRSRQEETFRYRVLRGIREDLIKVREGDLFYYVQPVLGQKSGAFLDLRGLRKKIIGMDLKGKRALNLFCYTGAFSLALEMAQAREIWNVDISRAALEFGKKFHVINKSKVKWIESDAFKWIKTLNETFEVIICDPPSMAAEKSQVKKALQKYKFFYGKIKNHVCKDGLLIACCCTSRIDRKTYKKLLFDVLGKNFKFIDELKPEDDHPVRFPEADYLKIFVFKKL